LSQGPDWQFETRLPHWAEAGWQQPQDEMKWSVGRPYQGGTEMYQGGTKVYQGGAKVYQGVCEVYQGGNIRYQTGTRRLLKGPMDPVEPQTSPS
jgi:hypothetical protein